MIIKGAFYKNCIGLYNLVMTLRFGKRSAYEDEGMDKRALQMMMRPRLGEKKHSEAKCIDLD